VAIASPDAAPRFEPRRKNSAKEKPECRAARALTQRTLPFFVQPRVVCQIVIRHRTQIHFDSVILSKEKMSQVTYLNLIEF
jgi:hypothetical protein